MNLRRSVLGLAMPLVIAAAACSSDDSTNNNGGSGGGGGVDASTRSDATTADHAVTADVAVDRGTSSDGSAASDAAPARDGSGGSGGGAATDALASGDARDGSDGGAVGDARDASDGSTVGEGGPAPVCGPFADGGSAQYDAAASPSATTSFFVTSQTNATGNLGGLVGADARCQTLATAAGLGGKIWHAYLSVEHDPTRANAATNARDRIGAGPWYNSRGVLVAADLAALHARAGDASVFLDEHGNLINGQWTGSPAPNEHDVLTGSNADGTVAVGKTCADWTSAQGVPEAGAPEGGSLFVARVGHTDGLGPMCSMATAPNNVTSWNSAHDNAGCDNTAPRGGAGHIYCFAVPNPVNLE